MDGDQDANLDLDDQIVDDQTGDGGDGSSDTELHDDKPDKPSKPESVRESINRALKETKSSNLPDLPGDKSGKIKPPAKGAAAPGQQAGDKGSTPTQGATGQPTGSVPDAWKSKELSPVWAGLAPAVQAAITKRETDMANGVQQLKTRYQDVDNAVAPYRENIKRFGFTEAQAVDQLFKWQMALAGPDKVRAFVALMQSHGVDPATFVAALQGASQGANPQPNNAAISPQVLTEIEGLKQRFGQYDQHFASQTRTAAEQTVSTWAKDKPHYNAVRQLMGQLIQSGAVPLQNGQVDLDAAYNMAIHAHPETRALVAQEQKAKEIADRKAAADKARKAGSSMRSGAPVPPSAANGAAKQQRDESVRDSIKRALTELRQ